MRFVLIDKTQDPRVGAGDCPKCLHYIEVYHKDKTSNCDFCDTKLKYINRKKFDLFIDIAFIIFIVSTVMLGLIL